MMDNSKDNNCCLNPIVIQLIDFNYFRKPVNSNLIRFMSSFRWTCNKLKIKACGYRVRDITGY